MISLGIFFKSPVVMVVVVVVVVVVMVVVVVAAVVVIWNVEPKINSTYGTCYEK